MTKKKPLTEKWARELLLKFHESVEEVGSTCNRLDLVYFNPRTERYMIDLLSSRVGINQFQLDGKGLYITSGAADCVLAEARQKIATASRRLSGKGLGQANASEFKTKLRDHSSGLPTPKASSVPVAQEQSTEIGTLTIDPLEGRHEAEADPTSNRLHWRLVDEALVRIALLGCSPAPDRRARKTTLEQLMHSNVRRLPAVRDSHLEALAQIQTDFPNFEGVIDLIRDHLCLLRLGEAALSLPSILLLGPPGVGKTAFVNALGDALNLVIEMRSLAETSAAFAINGGHQTWGNAQMGAVAKLVIEAPNNRLPLLLLDEIDKVNRSSHSPEHVLLGLLEPHTAQRFRDEFLDIELDIRPMAIIATANVALAQGSPLASRFTTVRIGPPTAQQMRSVTRSVDRSLRVQFPVLAERFAPLSPALVDAVSQLTPRELRARLLRSYAVAARMSVRTQDADPIALTESHFNAASKDSARGVEGQGDGTRPSVRQHRNPSLLLPAEMWSVRVH